MNITLESLYTRQGTADAIKIALVGVTVHAVAGATAVARRILPSSIVRRADALGDELAEAILAFGVAKASDAAMAAVETMQEALDATTSERDAAEAALTSLGWDGAEDPAAFAEAKAAKPAEVLVSPKTPSLNAILLAAESLGWILRGPSPSHDLARIAKHMEVEVEVAKAFELFWRGDEEGAARLLENLDHRFPRHAALEGLERTLLYAKGREADRAARVAAEKEIAALASLVPRCEDLDRRLTEVEAEAARMISLAELRAGLRAAMRREHPDADSWSDKDLLQGVRDYVSGHVSLRVEVDRLRSGGARVSPRVAMALELGAEATVIERQIDGLRQQSASVLGRREDLWVEMPAEEREIVRPRRAANDDLTLVAASASGESADPPAPLTVGELVDRMQAREAEDA